MVRTDNSNNSDRSIAIRRISCRKRRTCFIHVNMSTQPIPVDPAGAYCYRFRTKTCKFSDSARVAANRSVTSSQPTPWRRTTAGNCS